MYIFFIFLVIKHIDNGWGDLELKGWFFCFEEKNLTVHK